MQPVDAAYFMRNTSTIEHIFTLSFAPSFWLIFTFLVQDSELRKSKKCRFPASSKDFIRLKQIAGQKIAGQIGCDSAIKISK